MIWIADVATAALLVVAFAAWVLGRFRVELLGLVLSVSSPVRPLVEAVTVLALRHWLVPSPSILARLSSFCSRHAFLGQAQEIAPILLAMRLGVLVIGYLAVSYFGHAPTAPPIHFGAGEWAKLPARYDASWYAVIAVHGYSWNPDTSVQQNLSFFPAFPMMVRLATLLLSPSFPPAASVWWVGIAVSLVCCLAGCVYLYRLAIIEVGEKAAFAAVAFLLSYPFAVYYSLGYTEGLFLLCAVTCWYFVRTQSFMKAVVPALLAGATRPNAILLSPLLLLLIVWQERSIVRTPRNWPAPLAVVMAPMLSFAAYQGWIWYTTGNPFFWAELQTKAWGRTLALVDWSILVARPPDVFLLDALAAVFALVAVVPIGLRLGLPYGVYVGASALLPLSNGGLVSFGRFSSVMFPIFLWLAAVVPDRHRSTLLVSFALLQGLVASLFFTSRPPY